MVFNSLTYAVFMLLVLGTYYALRRRGQNVLLLLASYVFYGWWDWRFLGLLAFTTVVDYAAALGIEGSQTRRRRRLFLGVSVGTNLLVLGFFKYFNFFAQSAAEVLTACGMHVSFSTLNVVLPVGISFYTFQSISYTIDVFRRRLPAQRNFWTFALYVSFFPQLVAGPIERASVMLPQLENDRRVGWDELCEAFLLMLVGFFKKVAVADTLAPLVEARFQHPHLASGPDLALALMCFSIQIYGDFSGYTDIARGTGRLLGIRLDENFRRPYFSATISEFWTRWHISLSSWFRDYVFLPLAFGLSRQIDRATWLGVRVDVWIYGSCVIVTLLLSGLWHGAAWTFVAWGGLHGLGLAAHRFLVARRRRRTRPAWVRTLWRFAGVSATLAFVTLAWIPFRSPSMASAGVFLTRMVSLSAPVRGGLDSLRVGAPVALIVSTLLAIELAQESNTRWRWSALKDQTWWLQALAYSSLILLMLVFGNVKGDVPFIYFQF